MTPEEAILMLDRIMYDEDNHGINWATGAKEAFNMAISALKKQDVPDINVGDLISRQRVSDLFDAWEAAELDHHIPKILRDRLKIIPSVQPEQSKASEFWRKRADFYSDMCMNLIGEMGKSTKIESVKISESGIEFIKEQPSAQTERKKGKWIGKSGSLHYCSECGWALMDNESGEPPYMGIDYHRENPERWMCCPGWNEWLMNFCPNCGADMRGGQE